MIPSTLRRSLLVILGLPLAACGYSPFPSSPAVNGTAGPVAEIEFHPLTNATFRPVIQAWVNDAVVYRLLREPRLALRRGGEVGFLLSGTLTQYANEGIGFDSQDIAKRFRLRITARILLKDKGKGRTLLHHEVVGETYYTAGEGVTATRAAEQDAATRVVGDLADRILAQVVGAL